MTGIFNLMVSGMVMAEDGKRVDNMVDEYGVDKVMDMSDPSPWFVDRYRDNIRPVDLAQRALRADTILSFLPLLPVQELLNNPSVPEYILPILCKTPNDWLHITRFRELSDRFILDNLSHLDLDAVVEWQSITDDTLEAMISYAHGQERVTEEDLLSVSESELLLAAEVAGYECY